MGFGVEVTGIDKMMESLKKYPSALKQEVSSSFSISGKKMVRSAKSDHRFKNRSGDTQRSIKYKVIEKKYPGLQFYLDDAETRSGRYSYGLIQMEGSANGYLDSRATEGKLPRKGKGKGIRADHFMDRAYDKELPHLISDLKDDMGKAAEKVGMK